MSKQVEKELIIEELEAIKMINDFKKLFRTSDLVSFNNEITIHLLAKDCAMHEVDRIVQLHITKDHDSYSYWAIVKDYIQQI